MKIQLLIAVGDKDYMEHISRVFSTKYTDSFDVSICSTQSRLGELLSQRRFDIAILDTDFTEVPGIAAISLPLILWTGAESLGIQGMTFTKMRKYQRISAIKSFMLGEYAKKTDNQSEFGIGMGRITAVWSPMGGSGKTTASLAYAAQLVSQGKKTVYLNLEPFSSTPVYFANADKGLTSVFEKLQEGNVGLLLQSIRHEDRGSGILYFCHPDNYEDIEILLPEDVITLVRGAASGADEVVVDLGSVYNAKIHQLLKIADQVFLVIDDTKTSRVKFEQFRNQHSEYEELKEKLTVIANKGASRVILDEETVIPLPLVQSMDPIVIYKTLSSGYFSN